MPDDRGPYSNIYGSNWNAKPSDDLERRRQEQAAAAETARRRAASTSGNTKGSTGSAVGGGQFIPTPDGRPQLSPEQQAIADQQAKARGQYQYQQSGQAAADKKKVADKKVADEQAATRDRVASANQAQGYVWINGARMRITGVDSAGNWTVTYDDGSGPGAAKPYPKVTAFDALDSQSIDGGAPFLMSVGNQLGPDGTTTRTTRPWDAPLSADAADRQYHDVVGKNMMTIQSGVQWFANLSTKDPGAYQALLDKLHSAGYLTDQAYASGKGGWSTDVAQAFASAARDVAVVNTTTGGENTTLDQLLDNKQGAAQQAKAAAYQPVDRDYTDPTVLRAQAKEAARAALGRELTPEEESRLVSHFRGLEAAKYDQIDAAGRAGKSATVTSPSASGQIDDFVSSGALEQEHANFQAAGYGQALANLMGVHL